MVFRNFKIADNGMAAISIWSTDYSPPRTVRIENCLIVGLSFGNANWYARPELVVERKRVGIIAPNSDGLEIFNVRFYNYFNFGKEDTFVTLETCARCDDIKRAISGGKTTYTK